MRPALDVSDTAVTISVEGFTGEQILDALFSALSQRVTSGYGSLPLEESIADAIEVREITMNP